MAERINSYKDLRVFKEAFELGMEIFELTKKFPSDQKYSYEEKGNNIIRVYSKGFIRAYQRIKTGRAASCRTISGNQSKVKWRSPQSKSNGGQGSCEPKGKGQRRGTNPDPKRFKRNDLYRIERVYGRRIEKES